MKNAVTLIWPVPYAESPLRYLEFMQKPSPLNPRLKELGWCDNEVLHLNRQDNTGLFLASMLKRPLSDSLSHEQCSHERCVAHDINDDDYKTRHTDDCPGSWPCHAISIDQQKLCSVLRDGGIPIVIISACTGPAGLPNVRVVDYYSCNIEYVAISHVWAHGLGNPKENALPLCQISRMARLCSELSSRHNGVMGKVGFWIDTLCIPVHPDMKDFRKLAIKKLASTYSQASQVLVLDVDLQRCSKFCSKTELATRILCSGWMKRLWTLQEAVMSKRLLIAASWMFNFWKGLENSMVWPAVVSLAFTTRKLR